MANKKPQPNPIILARKLWWDSKLVEIHDLVVYLGYKTKDVALHFGVGPQAVVSALNRRGVYMNSFKAKRKML